MDHSSLHKHIYSMKISIFFSTSLYKSDPNATSIHQNADVLSVQSTSKILSYLNDHCLSSRDMVQLALTKFYSSVKWRSIFALWSGPSSSQDTSSRSNTTKLTIEFVFLLTRGHCDTPGIHLDSCRNRRLWVAAGVTKQQATKKSHWQIFAVTCEWHCCAYFIYIYTYV